MSGRVCAAPGCDVVLSRQARLNVCRHHNHKPGVCNCTQCERLSERGVRVGPTTCKVPGCGTPIRGWGLSGVCANHLHAPGFCNCLKCRPDDRPVTWLDQISRLPPREAAAELAALGRSLRRAP